MFLQAELCCDVRHVTSVLLNSLASCLITGLKKKEKKTCL